MSERATAENIFLQDFAANAATLPGAGTPWLDARRAKAIRLVRERGVPNRRVEEWKYSDLRNTLANGFASGGLVRWQLERPPGEIELFDLGTLDHGAPDWVVAHLGAIVGNRGVADAASFALARSGLAIRVPQGVAASAPITLRYSGSGHIRVLLVLEEDASATLVETDGGLATDSRNIGLESVVGNGARLTHLHFEDSLDPPARIAVEEISISVGERGRYDGQYFGRGSKLSRVETSIVLSGAGAQAHLCGASVLSHDRHYDVTTHIDHAVGDTCSTQLFKTVANGHSRTVYQGKITVREGADGSDSRQTAKALLLGRHAEADLKPELEILAEDVKCAHGAAVGDLDMDSLFYLRSRGISEIEARALLIRGFLEEAVEQIENESLRTAAWEFMEKGLARTMEAQP